MITEKIYNLFIDNKLVVSDVTMSQAIAFIEMTQLQYEKLELQQKKVEQDDG